MKFVCCAVFLSIFSQSYADCLSRGWELRADDEIPAFKIMSCGAALDYVARNREFLEDQFGYEYAVQRIAPDDLAIEVRPNNQSATSFMYNREQEYWHYKGSCDDVPLGKSVRLETYQHCSDTGLTMYGILGDVTIKRFILNN